MNGTQTIIDKTESTRRVIEDDNGLIDNTRTVATKRVIDHEVP